jgi:hypothetical protein
MIPKNGSSKQQIPFTTPLFAPAHSTEEQIPISRREWQEHHTFLDTKKRKWETKQKKISEETQNVLWCFHMCCGVFHN